MSIEKEHFTHLKEIQSLDNAIKKHLDVIKDEELRLDDLHKLRQKKQENLEALKKENDQITSLISLEEKNLFDWEKKLQKAQDTQPFAKNEKEVNALSEEESKSATQVEESQNKILEHLDKQDELNQKMIEIEEFLRGSLETLEEMKQEIFYDTEKERKEILNYEKRIESLLEEVPHQLLEAFQHVRKKYRFKRPLVRVMNGGCEHCKFVIDKMSAQQIEYAKFITTCNQCERLFIPYDC